MRADLLEETRSLTDVLASMGVRHEKIDSFRRRLIAADGRDIGSYTASEAWEALDKIRGDANG